MSESFEESVKGLQQAFTSLKEMKEKDIKKFVKEVYNLDPCSKTLENDVEEVVNSVKLIESSVYEKRILEVLVFGLLKKREEDCRPKVKGKGAFIAGKISFETE
jgi:hypothetical protein